jgi:anti-sigma factor ChrR (cupin superfamily)
MSDQVQMTPGSGPGDYLDEGTAAAIALALKPQLPAPEHAAHLRTRVLALARVCATPPSARAALLRTVHGADRIWIRRSPGVDMCVLREDEYAWTFLLRVQPGAAIPPHHHELDEETLILEGDAWIGDDIHLQAGDYHYVAQGQGHPLLHSPQGCIALVRGTRRFQPRLTTQGLSRYLRTLLDRWLQ